MKVLGLVSCLCLATQLTGQEGLRSFDLEFHIGGEANSDNFGKSVCTLGDANGDWIDDFLVGADFADGGGVTDSGSVYLYSGADGSLIYQLNGGDKDDKFGGDIDVSDDIDGDGVKDFIVGARFANAAVVKDAGIAYVYSGATGVELLKLQGTQLNGFFGISVAAVGDTNLDGVPDFLVGSRGKVSSGGSLPGHAWLYSGADGTLLHHIEGTITADLFGDCVSRVGDINGDGAADLLIGAPGIPAVYLYSGLDGLLIKLWNTFSATSDAGTALAPIEDLTGDGLPEILVGDPADLTVHIFETKNFSSIGTLTQSSNYTGFGFSVASAGDIDQDGREDILVGAYEASPSGTKTGSAFIYSTANGSMIKRFDGDTNNGKYGCSVHTAGDINRDGLPDLIIGSRHGDYSSALKTGYIEVYSTRHYMAMTHHGQAPGAVMIETMYAADGDIVAFFYGVPGSSNVPIPDCGTVQLDLSSPTLDRLYQTGPTGRINFTVEVPPAAMGWAIQGVNLTSCETTNVVLL